MNLTRRSAAGMIFVAWGVSVAICLPGFVQEFIDQSAINFTVCQMNYPDMIMQGLTAATIILAFYFPLLIIVICYSVVFIKIKQKIDRKVAAKMEQLEMLSYSVRPTHQVVTEHLYTSYNSTQNYIFIFVKLQYNI